VRTIITNESIDILVPYRLPIVCLKALVISWYGVRIHVELLGFFVLIGMMVIIVISRTRARVIFWTRVGFRPCLVFEAEINVDKM
jgi:hypothetical protein